jgi:hypothetical protein
MTLGDRAPAEEALCASAGGQIGRPRWLEALSMFMTNPAGSAIVNATGPIRQIVQSDARSGRR